MSSTLERVPPAVREVVSRFATGLRDRFGARLLSVKVFGSYARGEAREFSDVDLFVLLDRVDRADRVAIYDLAGDLWAESSFFLAPLVFEHERFAHHRSQERPLVMDIEREGLEA